MVTLSTLDFSQPLWVGEPDLGAARLLQGGDACGRLHQTHALDLGLLRLKNYKGEKRIYNLASLR